LEPNAISRLVHDSGLDTLQPFVPPAKALLQESDLRTRLRKMRILMGPGPDQALGRALQMGQHARDGVGVAVRPAAHEINGAADRTPILADRAMLPEVVAALM